jgi:hypothetical protein
MDEFDFENEVRNSIQDGEVVIITDPLWTTEKKITKNDIVNLCELYGITREDLEWAHNQDD